jgi:hypothetical protein
MSEKKAATAQGETKPQDDTRTKRAGEFLRDGMEQVRATATTARDLLTRAVDVGLAKARSAGVELRSKAKNRSQKTKGRKTRAKRAAKATAGSRSPKRPSKSKPSSTASMPRVSRRPSGTKSTASGKGSVRSRKSAASRSRSAGRST